jgi:hypothetical protein
MTEIKNLCTEEGRCTAGSAYIQQTCKFFSRHLTRWNCEYFDYGNRCNSKKAKKEAIEKEYLRKYN